MFKKLITFVAFIALSVMGLQAQQLEQMPQDPELRKGVLENGLTYYIRHNAKPEGQAEFFIYDRVGAMQEEDLQIGLAHFLEHMAFNGTKNFPDKGIINYLESIGVKFGANLNAWTSLEQTQYMMQGVPVADESVIDQVLLILHDWAYYLSLEDEEIDAERGVILEELRTRNTASWRMREKMAPYLYNNTKYAERNIIGTEQRLKEFTYEELRSFYHRWYNTKNQCIVIVGDFDADMMEKKVIDLFSTIPAVEDAEEIEFIPIPATQEPVVAVLTDPENTDTSVEIIIRRDAMPKEYNNTVIYEMYAIMDAFASSIINERLSNIAQQPDAPFIAAGFYGGRMTQSMEISEFMASAREGEALKALEAAYAEMEKVRRYGFTVSEFERAKAKVYNSNQQAYERRNDRRSSEFMSRYTSNYQNNTPIYSAEYEWQLDSMLVSSLDLATLNGFVQQARLTPTNQVVIVSGPEKEPCVVPTEAEVKAVIDAVMATELTPYEEEGEMKPLISPDTKLKGSKVVAKKTTTDKFGSTVWTLKNGVKVVLHPTDYKATEIVMRGFSQGGTSVLADEDMIMGQMLPDFISYAGVGDHSVTDLQKQMAGKTVSVRPVVNVGSNGVIASCAPKDLETMLQLVYLYGTQPRYDEQSFNVVKDQLVSAYKNIASDPSYQLSDELYKQLYACPERYHQPTMEDIEALNFEQYKRTYEAMFSCPDDFTYIFVGNFDEAELKPLVEKYLGSLPKTKQDYGYDEAGSIRYATGDRTHRFAVDMQIPKATIYYVLTGPMEATLKNSLMMNILSQNLDIIYTKSIREEKGGTYGVSTAGSVSGVPQVPEYILLMTFDTDAERADELRAMLLPELERLAAEGPKEEDMNKIKEYMLKEVADARKQNGTWASWLNNYHLNDFDYVTDYEEILTSISADDVKAVAAKILEDNNILKLIMQPTEAQ